MNKSIDLTIVVPAFQEELVIDSTLRKLRDYIVTELKEVSTEVIVVTADSQDKTAQIVKRHSRNFKNFKFLEPGPKKGKGRDVKEGILASSGKYVLFTDADLATPLHHIKESLEIFNKEGVDVIIGTRDLAKIHEGMRKYVSLIANIVTRLLIDLSVKDTQCGFKAFTNNAAMDIFSRLTKSGWDFDIEVIAITKTNDYKVYHKAVEDWQENKPSRQQLVGESTIRASLKTLVSTLGIAWNMRINKYNPRDDYL